MSVKGRDEGLLMDVIDPTRASTTNVAVRLKLIRETFGISQRELAKRAGVTNSSISMIELGQVSPSIQSLERILSAIPIGLSDFFGFNPVSSVRVNRLFTEADICPHAEDQLIGRIVIMSPGESGSLKLLAHDTCGLVVEGKAQLKSVSAQELLEKGDSFYIPAGQLHYFVNPGESLLRLFVCSLFAHS